MPVNVIPFAGDSAIVVCLYLPIQDLELIDTDEVREARILCEDDQGGQLISIHCTAPEVDQLAPYIELYDAWRADPLGVETPVLPVLFVPDNPPMLGVSFCAWRDSFSFG